MRAADAGPRTLERSADFGPIIERVADHGLVPQEHELEVATESGRITIPVGDPASFEVHPFEGPARGLRSPDGTWGVESNVRKHTIVAGPIVDGKVVRPVVIHYPSTAVLMRYIGARGQERTVVLSRGNWRWFIVRSWDGGSSWEETWIDVLSASIRSSRASLHLISRDRDWIRIDRHGGVKKIPITNVEPSWSCASELLWVARGKRLYWFDSQDHDGTFDVTVLGPMACAGKAVLVPVDGGLVRCNDDGCGSVQPAGDFADLTSDDGIATATQRGDAVRVTRTGRAPVDVQLEAGEQLVGMAVWNDVPTLLLLGASKRLRIAPVPRSPSATSRQI